jgi:hypothetical protein
MSAQSFTNSTNLINAQSFNSGGCVGVADMDEDGYDDIIILHQSKNLFIYYQESNGSFTLQSYGSVSTANQWGMAVGDVDQDGHKDVICGGSYDGVHYIRISARGVFTSSNLPNGNMFMQGCNIADINNDGHLDYFACHDDAASRIWGNNGSGELAFQTWINLTTNPTSDNSGNYGSVWTDFDNDGDLDLYIAKCRQGVNNPNDPRRINMLFVNNGDGTYTEKAADYGVAVNEQSWTVDFADIDNDGDFDMFLTNHSGTLQIWENDGLGHFTDITQGSGIQFGGFFLQGKLVDFDNDGYVDLLYSGGLWGLYRNNGDKTFTNVSAASNLTTNDNLHSFGIGDLNKDGFLDIYASYGNSYVNPDPNNPDRLWLNNGNNNNWIAYSLEGTVSNSNAVGAKVYIYGDWGVQVREVRAGESYGINNTFNLHFGIGQATSVDQVVIKWPSGLVEVIVNPAINSFHNVVENECQGPEVSVVSSAIGLCAGESATLSAQTDAAMFLWSTGENTTDIEVSLSGNYYLYAWDSNGCASQFGPVTMQVVAPIAPTIELFGEVLFCQGQTAVLVANGGSDFVWSNGMSGNSIIVVQSGTYYVTGEVNCGTATSEGIEINVLPAPAIPIVQNVTLPSPNTAELQSNNPNTLWYLNQNDTEPAGEGAVFTTPLVSSTTQFWVEAFTQYGGDFGNGGKADTSGVGQIHTNSNFWLRFDAYEDFYIRTVKVRAQGTSERTIQVINSIGEVIAQGNFLIEDGWQTVELNFFVPAGTGYGLRTTGNPQLWRNGDGVDIDYPYDLGGLGAITSSSVTGSNALNFYYFFYDWTVETPMYLCVSNRVPVTVNVVGIDEISGIDSLTVYPNPTGGLIQIESNGALNANLAVSLVDMTGRQILSKQMQVVPGKTTDWMDLSGLAPGIYSLTIENNGQRAVRRIVKQ